MIHLNSSRRIFLALKPYQFLTLITLKFHLFYKPYYLILLIDPFQKFLIRFGENFSFNNVLLELYTFSYHKKFVQPIFKFYK